MNEINEGPNQPPVNPDLEDTREFTDRELMELGLIIEFFRKHPEYKFPRGFPWGDDPHRTEPPREKPSPREFPRDV